MAELHVFLLSRLDSIILNFWIACVVGSTSSLYSHEYSINMHIIYNVNINPLRPWTSSHTEEIGYTLIYLDFINIEKFTILMINVLEYVDIAICNRISYFDNFLNLAKKWMKIGCSRNIEETTVVYAITAFHTWMSAHNWRYMYMYYSLIFFIYTCMLVDMYFFIRFYKRYGGKTWMHFHFCFNIFSFYSRMWNKNDFLFKFHDVHLFYATMIWTETVSNVACKSVKVKELKNLCTQKCTLKVTNEEILILSHQNLKI